MDLDIYDELIDNDTVKKLDTTFNVEIKNNKVYDQKGSFICWIYAAINMIRNKIVDQFGEKIEISANYISFFDRYEKLNLLYDKIINTECQYSQIKYLLYDYINTCGDFSSFKYLIKKYGVVLEHQMPIKENNFIPNDINELIKEKVINDIDIIINKKSNKCNIKQLYNLKERMMLENYEILSNIFGKPPTKIDLQYLNFGKEMTPVEFTNVYINHILEDYVEIISLSKMDYNQKYKLDFNVPNLNNTEYLNLNINDIKRGIINSLKNKQPVWFGCSYRFMSASCKNKNGILFNNLYDFEKIGIKKLEKCIAEKYDFLNYDHAMLFTGVNIVDNKPISWKVLNSFGIQNNNKGYLVMDNDFFDENVFLFAIKKDYLS